MSLLNKINLKSIYLGYILIGVSINGFFGIFLSENNPGTPKWAWYGLAIIGGIIIGLKTLKFPYKKRLNVVFADLIFTSIFIFFATLNWPKGINFIVGPFVGIFFLYYVINQKFLQNLK